MDKNKGQLFSLLKHNWLITAGTCLVIVLGALALTNADINPLKSDANTFGGGMQGCRNNPVMGFQVANPMMMQIQPSGVNQVYLGYSITNQNRDAVCFDEWQYKDRIAYMVDFVVSRTQDGSQPVAGFSVPGAPHRFVFYEQLRNNQITQSLSTNLVLDSAARVPAGEYFLVARGQLIESRNNPGDVRPVPGVLGVGATPLVVQSAPPTSSGAPTISLQSPQNGQVVQYFELTPGGGPFGTDLSPNGTITVDARFADVSTPPAIIEIFDIDQNTVVGGCTNVTRCSDSVFFDVGENKFRITAKTTPTGPTSTANLQFCASRVPVQRLGCDGTSGGGSGPGTPPAQPSVTITEPVSGNIPKGQFTVRAAAENMPTGAFIRIQTSGGTLSCEPNVNPCEKTFHTNTWPTNTGTIKAFVRLNSATIATSQTVNLVRRAPSWNPASWF